ncbi:MAG: hypothetical protein ISQ13_00170 [Candidatus Margulisbacteria bacterium]|nr:hypothetical protein [Candidatus Margulisiibacteriota bacterium]
MAFLLTLAVVFICFIGLGCGVLFFQRKRIQAECGSVPNHPTNPCPSKAAGICPTQKENAKNDALDMALTFKKLNQNKHPQDSSGY